MKGFLKNQKGVTMMEVLVTVALLAIVVVPCLSAFVMAQRGNVLAAQTYNEYTAAQNLMEELKGIPTGTEWADNVTKKLEEYRDVKDDGIDVIYTDGTAGYFVVDIVVGESKNDDTDSNRELILKGVIAP